MRRGRIDAYEPRNSRPRRRRGDTEPTERLTTTTGNIARPWDAEVALAHVYAKGEYRETRARPNVDPDSEVAPDGFAERNVRVREFAGVAGATARQRFRYITLPLVFPTLIIAMLFRTVQAMRVYGVIEATGAGCTTVPSLSCTVVESMFGATQAYGTAAVAAVPTAASIGVVVSVYIVALRKAGGEAGPV